MRKIKLTTIIATLSLANIALADVPVIRTTAVHKEGGRRVLFGLCEERYNIVDRHTSIAHCINPYTNEPYDLHETTLYCKDPGNIKCRISIAGKRINYNGTSISEDIFVENENDLLDQVDKNLGNGIYYGKTSKKVAVKADGKQFLFLFEATWKNGNENGDADIVIKVYDITAYTNVTAGSANGTAVITR